MIIKVMIIIVTIVKIHANNDNKNGSQDKSNSNISSNNNSNRSSHWRCSVKKVFLEISQNSQENTCARVSFLIKLHLLLKKNSGGCFCSNNNNGDNTNIGTNLKN